MTLPSTIPLRRDPEGASAASPPEIAWIGVAAVLVLAVLAVWLMRRSQRKRRGTASGEGAGSTGWLGLLPRRHGGPVVLSSTRLTPKHSLHEVNWQGRRLLIGCAESATQLLGDLPMEPPHGANPMATPSTPAGVP